MLHHWNCKNCEINNEKIKSLSCDLRRISIGEAYLEEILKRDEKRYYGYDIFIPKLNLIVEVYGDYWHCNPIKYKPADIVCWGSWKITAEECWKKDFEKIDFAYRKGYNVIIIWENDWNNTINFKEEVSEYFKNQVH